MIWMRSLVACFLFHLALSQSPKVQYVLLVPSVLQESSLDKVCAQLFNLTESVVLTVSLNYGEVLTKIFEENVTGENFFKCTNFEVPRAASDPLAFITFSAEGATVHMEETRSVAIRPKENVVFVQTDKPIYKPAQDVLFRIVSLDDDLKPVEEEYPVITLKDPHGNHIQRWVDQKSETGILQQSFQLIPEPILGWYTITVEMASKKKAFHSFSVEEYVLPKFQLTVDAPDTILVVDSEFKVNVCSSYTYGKPVEGNVHLRVCRESTFSGDRIHLNSICKNFTIQLGKDGCMSQFINTDAFELNREGYLNYLEVQALVTESGTGVELTKNSYIFIDTSMVKMSFENMDPFYKQGLPYSGQIKLLHPDDSPIPNEVIQLHLKDKIVGNYTTDTRGIAQFSLDTSKFTYPNITLKATYKANENCQARGWVLPEYPKPEYFVSRFYSRTNSFLKIVPEREELRCNQQKQVTVHYLLNTEDLEDKTYTVSFNYLVISKGVIVLHGQQKIEIKNDATKGVFSIPVEFSFELAPSAVMLVYGLHPGGELVADTTRFQIEKCFKNEVNLNFSKERSSPGSSVSLRVSAASNSLCALLALDQSVLLLRGHGQLSADSVYNQLYYKNLYGYYFRGLDLEDGHKEPCLKNEQVLYKGIYYTPTWANFGDDAYDLVKAMGLKVFTNSHLRKPVLCKDLKYQKFYEEDASAESSGLFSGSASQAQGGYVQDTLRKSFPETWIWNLITTDSTGVANLSLTVPDSITQWKASGFCMNDQVGFGLSPTVSLAAFLPFFVEVTLPYSVVQGEIFVLKASVFNYLNRSVQINTELKSSNLYEARFLSINDENDYTRSNEKKSFTWLVTPHKLGVINITVTSKTLQNSGYGHGSSLAQDIGWRDTLIKPLLVEPEGIKKEMTQGLLICTNGSTVSQRVELTLPENLVKDSLRAYWTVLGDILGSAMQNLQDFLQMPFGCGEQNMALFASNIYILDYLNQTQQLTEEIKSKALGYLTTGYQKQMSYKHQDGSYSTFGHNDEQKNIWLTAFVYKSFAQARRYIYIDDKVQSQTLIWLLSVQKSDGCFSNSGNVFNNALKGEDDNDISLTAYVVNALLEAGHPVSFVAVQKGLRCIEAASQKSTLTTYDQALLTHTFSLVDNKDKREFFFNELSKKAKKVGGSVYWELKGPSSPYDLWASSASIEVTSYILLAFLSKPGLTSEELSYASQIVQWVAKQQNSRGGFSSTKDTVVALQALTLFQTLTFSKNRQNLVQIFSGRTFNRSFLVNDENRLVPLEILMPTPSRQFAVRVSGNGCVYVQKTLKYNILLPKKSSGFSLSVNTANAFCRGLFDTKFDLVVSASYSGKRNSSNMAIIDVKMLSGYVPDRSSVKKLQEDGKVQRVEIKATHIFFYLQNVTRKEIHFSFSIEQDTFVSNNKPASIQLYDYYATDEFAVAEYNTPCNQISSEAV
ncbi:ovostatin isoform X2 [Heterocephalus glaber]|uniref:Ovostatin isoform X2 n=1 Tax=Heterocephalus glaber TaxID=10181 RepID=A0AAX6S704_HETGA|nr:ovostatin isoform X2 [Heterocephalus glaber]